MLRMAGMKATLLLCMYLACYLQDLSVARQCNRGEIQLVGGQSELEGRVQVCLWNNRNYMYQLQWWSVCNVGIKDARVVCRQLGYSEDAYSVKSFTRTRGLILQMNCEGSEAELTDCVRYLIWSGQCDNDAGVHCESIPQNITAVATGTSVMISWRPPDSHGNSILQIRYSIVCSAAVSINNVTYEHRVETQMQSSASMVTLSELLPSTAYMCCVSTNPNTRSTAACSSATTSELAEIQETPPPTPPPSPPPNCSAVAGGLGALVVILVLLLVVVSIVLYRYLMVLRQKNMATDVNQVHTSNSAVNPNEDRTLHNPSYSAPSMEIPLENSNRLYSTVGPDYEIMESESSTTTAGIEGHEYSHLRH